MEPMTLLGKHPTTEPMPSSLSNTHVCVYTQHCKHTYVRKHLYSNHWKVSVIEIWKYFCIVMHLEIFVSKAVIIFF